MTFSVRQRWSRVVAGCVFVILLWTGVTRANASWLANGSGAAGIQAATVPAGSAPSATVSGRNVNVSWSSVTMSDASVNYTVRRYDAGTSAVQTVLSACTGSLSGVTCTENTLPAGSWRYSVQAVVGPWSGTESARSATVTTPPPAPTGLSAVGASASGINLTWTAAAGATSYQVQRATVSGGPYTVVGTSTGTSYGDTGLSASTAYYYVVKAVFGGAASTASSQATATTMQAVVSNKSFETGSLSSWTSSPAPGANGTDAATTGVNGISAHAGSWFAVIHAGQQDVYGRLSQTFVAEAGDTINGWAFFSTTDYQPYNDDGAVVMQQNGSDIATLFASSVGSVGDYGSSGWVFWSYTFPSAGTYTIDARIRNVGDGGGVSYLAIDDIGGTVAP